MAARTTPSDIDYQLSWPISFIILFIRKQKIWY